MNIPNGPTSSPLTGYKVRFVPLGGVVGVTKNMYLYEIYKDNALQDILIVDCGIGFPKEQELGVDQEIPDITYLKDKTDKIRAVLLTHGHEDHITALRFHYNALGRPPVFGSRLTALFVENKCAEYKIPLKVKVISFDDEYVLGEFRAKFIRMTHSIPDTTHILIKTPVGAFYHGSDFKMDLSPPFGYKPDFYEISKAGREGVLCLLSDCLGANREGFTLSESAIGKTFEDEMRLTKGKFIMTTFASNISRVRQCAEAAIKFNRKVCLLGRSMIDNAKLVKDLGYFPIPAQHLISDKQVRKYKPQNVCIIATGSQGQFGSALPRLVMGENRYFTVDKGDKVIFSSDPIPGNEDNVYEIIEHLYELGVDVRYSDIHEQLHASGHGSQGDMKLLMSMVEAKYLIPIGGTVRHQHVYQDLAKEMGYKEKDVFLLKEGDTVWFFKDGAQKGEQVKTKNIYVDSYGVGDVGDMILRDRMALSTEGVVLGLVFVDNHGKLAKAAEFTSRGFIFKSSQEVFDGAAQEVKAMFERSHETPLKRDIIGKLENYFRKKTRKEPLVVLEIVRV